MVIPSGTGFIITWGRGPAVWYQEDENMWYIATMSSGSSGVNIKRSSDGVSWSQVTEDIGYSITSPVAGNMFSRLDVGLVLTN